MAQADFAGAFLGQWEDPTGTVLSVQEGVLSWPDGKTLELNFPDEGVCCFRRGHNTYEGKLTEDANSLVWPGGAVWVRTVTRRRGHQGGRAPQRLTLQRALDLQGELRASFADPGFQRKLRALEQRHAAEPEALAQERSQLLLAVQGRVLPKYGFQGNRAGVLDMLEAGAQFNGSEEYCRNRDMLNELLGFGHESQSSSVEVILRDVFDDAVELRVVLPRDSTFRELRTAVSELVQSDAIFDAHLVRKERGAYRPFGDEARVTAGEVRVFGPGLSKGPP